MRTGRVWNGVAQPLSFQQCGRSLHSVWHASLTCGSQEHARGHSPFFFHFCFAEKLTFNDTRSEIRIDREWNGAAQPLFISVVAADVVVGMKADL